MMRTMWPTITLLALLVGIAGCFSYRDWRGNPYRQEYRPHYVDTDRDPPDRNCWQLGDDWFCRGSATDRVALFAW